MKSTSQVGTTARHNVAEGLTSAFVGVDVGLSREKARATIRQNFVYKQMMSWIVWALNI